MKIKFIATIFLLCLFACNSKNEMKTTAYTWSDAKAPIADQKEHKRMLHADTVNDPYFWMYDYFGKGSDSTKVVEYLIAENVYLDTMMAATKKLQEKLFTEMKARIKEKDQSVPYFKNGYYYYSRTEDGKQYYKYCHF